MTELVEVTVGSYAKWYMERGYEIPTHEVQLWRKGANGTRAKNGIERRVPRGTKIWVRPEDLMPASNKVLVFTCATCGKEFTTRWDAYKRKQSKNCKSCAAKKGFKGGCQTYWQDVLIFSNPDAKCDISGETDKRFLVLHHLLSRSVGGANTRDNYVVITANYHLAFHAWMGGHSQPCRPEDYHRFKALELAGSRPTPKTAKRA